MQWMVYWFFGALVVATIVLAVVVGGAVWIAPPLAIVIGVAYAAFDARLKRRESGSQRASAQVNPDR